MTVDELPERTRQAYEFVRRGLMRDRRAPVVREISAHLGCSSVNAAKYHLDILVGHGLLERLPGARGLRLPHPAHCPICGYQLDPDAEPRESMTPCL